jgi:hypothetical protein
MSCELIIEQYSEKAIAVRGNTQPYKENLKDLGGKWNAGLRGGGGWIFPNSKKIKIEELNGLISKGEITAAPIEKKTYIQPSSQSLSQSSLSSSSSLPVNDRNFVPLKEYLALLSRVERLEQICSHVDFVKGISSKKDTKNSNVKNSKDEINIEEDSDESEEEEPQAVERLMKNKNKK